MADEPFEVADDSGAACDFLSPEGVEKVDDLTIKLRLDRPNADMLLSFYDHPSMIAPEGGWKDFYGGNPADAIGTPFMMESDYIRTAMLKGLSNRTIIRRPALIVPFTVIMLHVNWLIGGVVVVEVLFRFQPI